jgi:hypothetical protein
MSVRNLLTPVVLVLSVLFISCENKNRIEGNGNMISYKEKNIPDFNSFYTNGNFYYYINQDTFTEVEYWIDDNLLPYISTNVFDDQLRLTIVEDKMLVSDNRIEVHITTPDLTWVESVLGGQIYIPELNAGLLDIYASNDANIIVNKLDAKNTYIKNEGYGGIYLFDAQSDTLIADLTSSGRIEISNNGGESIYANYLNQGSGVILTDRYDVDVCDARIEGPGDITVNAINELYGYFYGEGFVFYRTQPKYRLLGEGPGPGTFDVLYYSPHQYQGFFDYKK